MHNIHHDVHTLHKRGMFTVSCIYSSFQFSLIQFLSFASFNEWLRHHILLFLFYNSVFFCFFVFPTGSCCFALSYLNKQGLPWNTNENGCQNMLLWIITLMPTICFLYKSWVKSPRNILSTAQLYPRLKSAATHPQCGQCKKVTAFTSWIAWRLLPHPNGSF